MQPITRIKIEIFIPETHLDLLREALAQAGVGVVGNYDHCLAVARVEGYWRPLPGADPYAGTVGEVMHAPEVKVEVNCAVDRVPAALQAIRSVHPYEEPVINLVPLVNDWFPGA
jgi:hypothetical protein